MTLDAIRTDVAALALGWREWREVDRKIISHRPLIAQLREAMHAASSSDEVGGKTGKAFSSKPPMQEDAWIVLATIEKGVRDLLHALRAAPRVNVIESLTLLVAIAGRGDLDEIEAQTSAWRRSAETCLSYRQPARRLAAPCPLCARPHALYVVVDEFGPESARCSKCGATWDSGGLGMLAGMLAGAGSASVGQPHS